MSMNEDGKTFDLALIDDPHVRRSLRAMYDDILRRLEKQQMEIETIVQTLIDRHVTSLSEFRLMVQRLRQHGGRTDRVHEALEAALGKD